MSEFKKGVVVADLLSDKVEMIGEAMPLETDAVEFNKRSLAELDEVLDQIQISPAWIAKLEQIIEDANSK